MFTMMCRVRTLRCPFCGWTHDVCYTHTSEDQVEEFVSEHLEHHVEEMIVP